MIDDIHNFDPLGRDGNSGHGPGYHYDQKVGPRGSALAWWVFITIVACISWLFGL